MNKYQGWQALYMAFFSGDLYRDVARNWKGVGYLYLTALVLGAWFIMSIANQILISNLMSAYVQPFAEKWPKVTIKDWQISVDRPSPYIIEMGSGLVLDFDTRDDAKLPDGKIGFLVAKDGVKEVDSAGATRSVVDLEAMKSSSPPGSAAADGTIDKSSIQGMIDLVKTWSGVFIFCFFAPWCLFSCIMQSLIFGAVGMLVSSILNAGLTYGQAVRIAVIAMTPGMVLGTLIGPGGIVGHGPGTGIWMLLWIALAIGYVVYGVRSTVSAGAAAPDATAPPAASA